MFSIPGCCRSYGMMTRLIRDYGFDFYWADKYCQNTLARGFEYTPEAGNYCKVTAMKVIKHTENSVIFIQKPLAFAQTDTLVSQLNHTIP